MARRAFSRAAIMQRLFNTPLAVTSDTAAVVLGAIGQRLDVSQLFLTSEGRELSLSQLESLAAEKRAEIEARAWTDQRAPKCKATDLMPVIDRVAFVEIRGELVAENGIGPMSGFTGYDGILAQVAAADADPDVRGIIMDHDSPGGEVSGLYEACARLMTRRGAKPMRSVIRGLGASADYAIAACADEVTLHDLGYAGSIGTIMMHVDFSEALAKDGIKVRLFAAGEHKADGNPYQPLSDDVAERLNALVQSANQRFIDHVATARNMDPEAVRAQQARIYQGQEAVDAGLVDKVMSWSDSIAEFIAQVNAPAQAGAGGLSSRTARHAPGARSSEENTMEEEGTAPAADQQSAEITAARADATAQAQAAERDRVAGLIEVDASSNVSAPLASAIADGTSVGDFARAQAKAEKEQQTAALAAAQGDAAKPGVLPVKGATAAEQPGQSVNRGKAAVERMRGKHPGLPAQA